MLSDARRGPLFAPGLSPGWEELLASGGHRLFHDARFATDRLRFQGEIDYRGTSLIRKCQAPRPRPTVGAKSTAGVHRSQENSRPLGIGLLQEVVVSYEGGTPVN